MSNLYIYSSIIIMAVLTYLIRALPLAVFRKPINNRFFRSFLTYAPYVTLSVLTFPSVFECTGNVYTALGGTVVALICLIFKRRLLFTIVISCLAVYLLQLIL